MRRPILILPTAGVLLAALVGLVLREDRARAAGTEVLLAMQPLDPRSLLGGHYVVVDIVHPTPACPLSGRDNDGWIALSPRGRTHEVTGNGRTREAAAQKGTLTVRGVAYCVSGGGPQEIVQLRLRGVDRFHADQDEAQAIEKALNASRTGLTEVFAIVSVGADGQARLRGLEVNGRRTELSWF